MHEPKRSTSGRLVFPVRVIHLPHRRLWTIHLTETDHWFDGETKESVLAQAQAEVNTWVVWHAYDKDGDLVESRVLSADDAARWPVPLSCTVVIHR